MKRMGMRGACNTFLLLMLLCGAFLLGGCGDKITSRDSDANTAPANVTMGAKPQADAEVAVIEMENPGYGRIVMELYPNIAPKMVERFKQLIREGFYNGTAFHRINPDAGIIQGGDPLSKDADPENDGTGSSPSPNIPAEFSDIPYERGIVGAARRGAGRGLTEQEAWNTANCQFYITLKRQPAFDQKYTVFGRVIEGINNADIIAGAPMTEAGSERPSSRIIIKSVTLQPRSNFK